MPYFHLQHEDEIRIFGDGDVTWDWYPGMPTDHRPLRIDLQGAELRTLESGDLKERRRRYERQAKAAAEVGFTGAPWRVCSPGAISDYVQGMQQLIDELAEETEISPEADWRKEIYRVLHEIKEQDLIFDNRKTFVNFDQWGAATSRLRTHKGVSVLSMNTEKKSRISPQNGAFIEADWNAVDIRTFLHLLEEPQPDYDIHSWNMENVLSVQDRSEAKKAFFAWFYGGKDNATIERVYDRDKVLSERYRGGELIFSTGRKQKTEERLALSHLIQTESAYRFLNSLIALHDGMRGMNSFVSFGVHDSFYIDLDKSELDKVLGVLDETMTRDGFVYGAKIGPNPGEMPWTLR